MDPREDHLRRCPACSIGCTLNRFVNGPSRSCCYGAVYRHHTAQRVSYMSALQLDGKDARQGAVGLNYDAVLCAEFQQMNILGVVVWIEADLQMRLSEQRFIGSTIL